MINGLCCASSEYDWKSQVVILLIPYAGDVYLDLFVNVDINDNFGVPSLVRSQVNSFLGSGLKAAVSSALKL